MGTFLREVHCYNEKKNRIQVTLVFSSGPRDRHIFLDKLYEGMRNSLYNSRYDVECFYINLGDNGFPTSFSFDNIYSGDHQVEDDCIHLSDDSNLPPRPVRYYAENYYHPIVFVNTSNHAMAEYDTNRHLWKWEYVPWLDNSPVMLGNKSLREVDEDLS